MRSFHLAGLPGPAGRVFRASADGPLVLPAFLPAAHQEQILVFYAQHAAAAPLVRIEVDWRKGILEPSRVWLGGWRTRHGSGSSLVVVRVDQPGQHVDDVVAAPELRVFEHLAVVCEEPTEGVRLGKLRELAQFTEEWAELIYEAEAAPLGLDEAGWRAVAPLAHKFFDPVDVIAVLNAVVDVQLNNRRQPLDGVVEVVRARVLSDRLRQCSAEALITVLGYATSRTSDAERLLGSEVFAHEQHRLRTENLLLDGRLTRWAADLGSHGVREALAARLPTRAQDTQAWSTQVREAVTWLKAASPYVNVDGELRVAHGMLEAGALAEARQRLDEIDADARRSSTPETRRAYWDARARLLLAEGRWPEARSAFEDALRIEATDIVGLAGRVATLLAFAQGLLDNGENPAAMIVVAEVASTANAVPVIKEAVIEALRRRFPLSI